MKAAPESNEGHDLAQFGQRADLSHSLSDWRAPQSRPSILAASEACWLTKGETILGTGANKLKIDF